VKSENLDALTLYHDPDRRERLGRSGRAYVEARYTPQVVARQYASLLERTTEGGWGDGENKDASGVGGLSAL
jgi:glycosyltransferase involved in cell wall biosynthesis